MSKWGIGAAPALLAGLLMIGCGDAGESGQPAADSVADSVQAAAEAAADTTPGPAGSMARQGDIGRVEETEAVRVNLTEWGITVSDSSITSGPVTLVIQNDGDLPHVLEIIGEYAGRNRSAPVPPGGSALMSMSLSAGRYTLFCPQTPEEGEPHRARGMETRLTVR